MNNIFLNTVLVLLGVLPMALWDGKRYRVLAAMVFLLLPFYQSHVYYRYLIGFVIAMVFCFKDVNSLLTPVKDSINKCLIVFFVFAVLSSFFAQDIKLTIAPLIDLVFFYLFFLVASLFLSKHFYSSYLVTVLLVGLVISVFVQAMQMLGVEAFYIFSEDQLNANTGIFWETDTKLLRFWGTFGNSLSFSAYLSAVGIWLFIYYNNALTVKQRVFSYFILGITFYAIFLTASRTALVSAAIGVVFYMFLKNAKTAIVFLIIAVGLLTLFSSMLSQLTSGGELAIFNRLLNIDEDKTFRVQLWLKALPILENNPLFGSGPGNLNIRIAPLVRTIQVQAKGALSVSWGHVENTFLSVLYTFGLTGFVCFIYMIFRSIYYSVKAIKHSTDLTVKRIGYSMTVTWLIVLINMISNPAFVIDYRFISLMLFFVAISVQLRLRSPKYIHYHQAVPSNDMELKLV